MDLKTFVTETLTQIADGIKTAQERQKELGASFSPEYYKSGENLIRLCDIPIDIDNNHVTDQLELVEFDVALTVSANVSGGAKAGLEVIGASFAGAKTEVSKLNETVSHVKFSVVVRWPRESIF